MANFDDFKIAVEAISGSKNTVLLDDVGMPSVVVPIPKFNISDVIEGGSETTHPAFIVNGVEKEVVYVSKFLNVVVGGRAYSLAGKNPAVNIYFDDALAASRTKGAGWTLMPFSLWQAISLWSRKNGTLPRGNTDYGKDVDYPLERGVPTTYDETGRPLTTATGTGPATWNHNHAPDGIADMCGNVWDWTAGARLVDGEIQVIPYANVFDPEVSLAAESTAWKAISRTGSLVNPGTANTLKYAWDGSKIMLTAGAASETEDVDRITYFNAFGIQSGFDCPELAAALNFYPAEPGGDYGRCRRTYRLMDERLPSCGGGWYSGRLLGVFSSHFYNRRAYRSANLGFRSAFCNL